MKFDKRVISYAFLYVIKNPGLAYKFFLHAFFLITKRDVLVMPPRLGGYQVYLDLNAHMDRNLFYFGKVDEDLAIFIKKYTRTNSVFFDIGANSGYFSFLAAKSARRGIVHSFEPVPKTHRLFDKTMKKNLINNIVLNMKCIGKKTHKVTFYIASNSDVSSLHKTKFHMKSTPIRSEMITLTDYIAKKNIQSIDIIKIDVEGGEKDILFHSVNILKKFRPIIIVEFYNIPAEAFHYHPNQLYDFLKRMGYELYSFKSGKLKVQQRQDIYTDNVFCFYNSKHNGHKER